MLKHKSFLWPDHAIGKRESRTIREEHNATVNTAAELLTSLRKAEAQMVETRDSICLAGAPAVVRAYLQYAIDDARAAIAKATGEAP